MDGRRTSTTDAPIRPAANLSAPSVSRFPSGRLRQLGLAALLGIAILGSVYFAERGTDQSAVTPVDVPGVSGSQALRVGEPAPDFTVSTPDGGTIRLADLKGKPLWINFWASWCAPCRAEFPDMNAVYQQEQGAGLQLLAISFSEQPGDVASYLDRAQPSFAIGVDPKSVVASEYRVMGLPTHIFIDADGIVRDIRVGPMNQDLMREKLATIIPAAG